VEPAKDPVDALLRKKKKGGILSPTKNGRESGKKREYPDGVVE